MNGCKSANLARISYVSSISDVRANDAVSLRNRIEAEIKLDNKNDAVYFVVENTYRYIIDRKHQFQIG